MLIFGHYHKKTGKQPVTIQLTDENGQTGPVQLDVYQQFIHIFWIPVAPVAKKVGYKKDDELYTIDTAKLPAAAQQAVQQALAATPTPVWGFAGLVLLLGLLAYGYFFVGNDTEPTPATASATTQPAATTSAAPAVGDVWVLTYGSNAEKQDDFTFARVGAVTADSVEVYMCKRSFTLKGFRQLQADDFAKVVSKQSLEYSARAVRLSFKQVEMRKAERMLLHVLPAQP